MNIEQRRNLKKKKCFSSIQQMHEFSLCKEEQKVFLFRQFTVYLGRNRQIASVIFWKGRVPPTPNILFPCIHNQYLL